MTPEINAWLSRIEAKLDLNTHATFENTTNLKEHMRRTELLEAAHKETALDLKVTAKETEARFIPLEKHVAGWAGAGKLLAVAAVVASLIGSIVALVMYLR